MINSSIKLLFLLIAIQGTLYGMQESLACPEAAEKRQAQELQSSEVIRLRELINDPKTTPQNRAIAQVNLGEIYYHGSFGVQKDVKKARRYLMQAAAQEANQFAKAIAQESVAGIDKEEQEAQAAACSLPSFVNTPADRRHGSGEQAEQVPQRRVPAAHRTKQPLQKKQEQNEEFQRVIRLTALVNSPSTTPKDRAKAHMKLGDIFLLGLGVEKDHARAAESYKRVLDNSHIPRQDKAIVQAILCNIYYNGGFGVEKDYAQAAGYAKQAYYNPATSPRNRAIAQEMLGSIYYNGGFGVEKDYAQAAGYAKQAYDNPATSPQDRAMTEVMLGSIYYNGGFGVQKDLKEARKYLMQAAAQDANADAKVNAQNGLAVIDKEEKEAQAVAPQQLPQQQARVAIKRSPVEELPGKSKRMRREEEDKERENEE